MKGREVNHCRATRFCVAEAKPGMEEGRGAGLLGAQNKQRFESLGDWAALKREVPWGSAEAEWRAECRRPWHQQGGVQGVETQMGRRGLRAETCGRFNAKAACLSAEWGGQGRAEVGPAVSSSMGD